MMLAGWYRDPTGHGDGRYWDGQRWGDQISRDGITMTSPMDPAGAEAPPAPGTEYVAPPPTSAISEPAPAPPTPRSPLGPILGGIAVVVAVIALIIALTSGDDDSDDEEPPSTTIEEPEVTVAPETPAE